MKVTNLNTFIEARGFGEVSMGQVRRNTYKYTDCGAWIKSDSEGISVGSIVEGCDEGTQTHKLKFPFEIEDYWKALETVEKEAAEIWDNTHGCEGCGLDGAINPDCKTCDGEGSIL